VGDEFQPGLDDRLDFVALEKLASTLRFALHCAHSKKILGIG
jgi:hypothetical protein